MVEKKIGLQNKQHARYQRDTSPDNFSDYDLSSMLIRMLS